MPDSSFFKMALQMQWAVLELFTPFMVIFFIVRLYNYFVSRQR